MKFYRESLEGITDILITLRPEVHNEKIVKIIYDDIGYSLLIGKEEVIQ